MPPLRSRPWRVCLVSATASEPASRTPTSTRMKKLRRRSVMSLARSLLLRGQDEEEPAVVVVGREQVGRRLGREVALGVDLDRLAELPHPPFEHGRPRVLVVGEPQTEPLAGRPADDALLLEPGELEGPLAGADQAPL